MSMISGQVYHWTGGGIDSFSQVSNFQKQLKLGCSQFNFNRHTAVVLMDLVPHSMTATLFWWKKASKPELNINSTQYQCHLFNRQRSATMVWTVVRYALKPFMADAVVARPQMCCHRHVHVAHGTSQLHHSSLFTTYTASDLRPSVCKFRRSTCTCTSRNNLYYHSNTCNYHITICTYTCMNQFYLGTSECTCSLHNIIINLHIDKHVHVHIP